MEMFVEKRFWWGTAVGLLLSLMLVVLLISLGVFDPQPVGPRRWLMELTPLSIAPQARQVVWLETVPEGAYSLRLTAAYQSGEKDSLYGLVLNSDGEEWVTAVSPSGYVTMWKGDSVILPWQPWPHVQGGERRNEIWLDHAAGRMTVRINGEILWQGEATTASRAGIIGESFGETAEVDFLTLALFAPE